MNSGNMKTLCVTLSWCVVLGVAAFRGFPTRDAIALANETVGSKPWLV